MSINISYNFKDFSQSRSLLTFENLGTMKNLETLKTEFDAADLANCAGTKAEMRATTEHFVKARDAYHAAYKQSLIT